MHGESPKRPVLRYHGGKWRLAKWVTSHFPPHRVYVEPFGGAASVLLQKPRTYAEVYNDLNGDVVNVFQVLRDPEQADRLRHELELTPFARDEYEATFAADDEADAVERARRLIVRSFMSFAAVGIHRHTGFRSDLAEFRSPAMSWTDFPDELAVFTARLRGVVIENCDAIDVITRYNRPGTLIYCDPPYFGSDIEYGPFRLSEDGHRSLVAALNAHTGLAVVSGYRSDLIDELYAGWHTVENADARAHGNRQRTEVLWLNAAAADALEASRVQPSFL